MIRSSLQNKTLEFDIDGVICSEEATFGRFKAKPNYEVIDTINFLYKNNIIIIATARGWSEFELTQAQLNLWGVNYHSLICGKPTVYLRVDDRSISDIKDLPK